jgi:hypothetical protein
MFLRISLRLIIASCTSIFNTNKAILNISVGMETGLLTALWIAGDIVIKMVPGMV